MPLCRPAPSKTVVILCFLLLYLLIGCLAYDDFGVSTDEFIQRNHALVSMKYLLDLVQWTELAAHPRFSGIPPLADYAHRSYGVVFHMPLLALEMFFDLDRDQSVLWRLRHLYTFLWFFTGALFFGALLNKLYGWKLALVGLLFLIVTPRIFANSFYNVKDTAFLAVICVSMYAALIYLRNPTLRSAALLAFSTAIAINVRFAGVMVITFVFFIIILDWLFTRVMPNKKQLLSMVSLPVLTVVFTLSIWPASWTNTVDFLVKTFLISTNYVKWNGSTVFLGERIRGSATPWNYIEVWMLVTIPIGYTLLFVLGLCSNVKRFLRVETWAVSWVSVREQFFFITLFFAPLMLVIAMRSTLHGDWRHLYFVYPSFLILSIAGLRYALQKRQEWMRTGHAMSAGFCNIFLSALVGHVAYTGYWMYQNHPNQQVYFNALAGKNIAEHFERDIWGLSARAGMEFILENDGRSGIRVAGIHSGFAFKMLDADARLRIKNVPRSDDWDYQIVTYRNAIGDLKATPLWTEVYMVNVDETTIMTVIRKNR